MSFFRNLHFFQKFLLFKFMPKLRPVVFPTWFSNSPKTLLNILSYIRMTTTSFASNCVRCSVLRKTLCLKQRETNVSDSKHEITLTCTTKVWFNINCIFRCEFENEPYQDFTYRSCATSAQSFSNMVCGLAQNCRSIVYLRSELWNNFFQRAEERHFQTDLFP